MPTDRLLVADSPLQVLPSLVKALDGSLPAAMVLQQLHYLTRDSDEPYVASFPEWETEAMRGALDERTVRRALTRLRTLGLVLVKAGPASDRRNRYRVNREAVAALGLGGQDDLAGRTSRTGSGRPPSPGQSGQVSKGERGNSQKNGENARTRNNRSHLRAVDAGTDDVSARWLADLKSEAGLS